MNIKQLRKTKDNLDFFVKLSEHLVAKETHIIIHKKRIIFLEHELHEICDYCNLPYDENNIYNF